MHSIVDELVSQLAEARRAHLERHAAYVALARAILAAQPLEAQRLSELDSQAA